MCIRDSVHNVFHVSMLRKYNRDDAHVIEWEKIEVRSDGSYIEEPLRIVDRKEHVLRRKVIPLVKVVWSFHGEEEATWETEEEMKKAYPHLFAVHSGNFEDEV